MTLVNGFFNNLVHAAQQGRAPIIAEIKPFTPSSGDLLRGRDIVRIAEEYIAGGAACLSVVTGKWYGGNTAMLERLAASVDYPLLRKDFIINREQVRVSKEMGAHAVLLTKRLLQQEHLDELAAYALSINVMPFVEVASESEFAGYKPPPGTAVAVNNKDIRIRETDAPGIGKSLALLSGIDKAKSALYISASGVETPSDVTRLLESGYDGVLIGTALLRTRCARSEMIKFASGRDAALHETGGRA